MFKSNFKLQLKRALNYDHGTGRGVAADSEGERERKREGEI